MSTNAHSDNLAESSDGFIIEVGSPANISFVIQNDNIVHNNGKVERG